MTSLRKPASNVECRKAYFDRLAELVRRDPRCPWDQARGLSRSGDLGVVTNEWRREVASGYNNGLLIFVFTHFGGKLGEGDIFGVLISLGQQAGSSAGDAPEHVKFMNGLMEVLEHDEIGDRASRIPGVKPVYLWDRNDRGRRWTEFRRSSSRKVDDWRLNADIAYELLKRLRLFWDELLLEAAEAVNSGDAAHDVIARLVTRPITANPPIHKFEQQVRTGEIQAN